MLDIGKIVRVKQEMNALYVDRLRDIGLTQAEQENMFDHVSKLHHEWMERQAALTRTTPMDLNEIIDVYCKILDESMYSLKKALRNMSSKLNKKIIASRGNLMWNSARGTYRNREHIIGGK